MRPPTSVAHEACCSTGACVRTATRAGRSPPPRVAASTRDVARPRRSLAAGRRPAPPSTATSALSPTTPGPEIWVGAALPVAVFALGTWEFVKRIVIQRRCPVCAGTGLVTMGAGTPDSPSRLVKCRACGGFFPWQSWQQFLSSTAAPGNGGPLQQPTLVRQASVVYRVPTVEEARAAAAAAGVATVGEEGGDAAAAAAAVAAKEAADTADGGGG